MAPRCACPTSHPGDPTVMKCRVTVYAGPTGGHLFPAQSFAEGFRKRFPVSRIDLLTSTRSKTLIEKIPAGIFDRVYFLPEFGFPGKISWKTFKPFLLAPYLLLQAFFYLSRRKPDLCVGFASFVSYPGMMMAHWLGIPTMIHEQNRIPGKATCWLAPHMDRVIESFEGTKFPSKMTRVIALGLPLRSSVMNAKSGRRAGAAGRPLRILIVGGSQGAKGLNHAVMDAMGEFTPEERSQFAVIHITGKQDQTWVSERYKQLSISNEIYSFSSEMGLLFQKADLAVTRAGANTLFELAFFGVPALVIPYPHAGGHQRYNAQGFAERGGLLYHEEGPGAKEWLVKELRAFLKNPEKLRPMAEAMEKLAKPQATETLVEVARKLIAEHENCS